MGHGFTKSHSQKGLNKAIKYKIEIRICIYCQEKFKEENFSGWLICPTCRLKEGAK